MTVCIGNISRGEVSRNFAVAVHEALRTGAAHEARFVECGPYLDAGRNEVVASFLRDTQCDWLLFVDSDIAFTPDDVTTLIEGVDPFTTPVVGGLYMNPTKGHVLPVAYMEGTAATETFRGEKRTMLWHTPIDLPSEDAGPVPVDAIGTGFLAIHRDLLTKMADVYEHPREWFAVEVVEGTQLGEDLAFCRRVRDLGYPIVLNPRVRLGHIKQILLTPDNFKERD